MLDECLQHGTTPVLGPVWVSRGERFSPSGVREFLSGLIVYTRTKLKDAKRYQKQVPAPDLLLSHTHITQNHRSTIRDVPNSRVYQFVKFVNTHTCLTALFPGLPGWAGTRKVKSIWILLKQGTVSGNGISWAVCKSAPRSRQITTPAPHHSVFYRPDALPAAHPTASKHWRQKHWRQNFKSVNIRRNSFLHIFTNAFLNSDFGSIRFCILCLKCRIDILWRPCLPVFALLTLRCCFLL